MTSPEIMSTVARIVNKITTPILWLTLYDASIGIYWYCIKYLKSEEIDYHVLLWHHWQLLLVLAVLAGIATWLVSRWCGNMIRPNGGIDLLHKDLSDDQGYLQHALSASLAGVVLIVLEPLLSTFVNQHVSLNFEELLLASSGLNILVEEAKLAQRYRTIIQRRNAAETDAEILIKQIEGFRAGVIEVFNESFGIETPGNDSATQPHQDNRTGDP